MRLASIALLALAACGGPLRPEYPMPMPAERGARDEAIAKLGQQLYRALEAGSPRQLLLDDEALGRILDDPAATRARALRLGAVRVDPARFRTLERATPSALCIQGARQESPGGHLGLRQAGWVFERALVIGTQPGGRRVASWVEGAFVFTNAGFAVIALTRVEAPRWEHSDLELTTCDSSVEFGPDDLAP